MKLKKAERKGYYAEILSLILEGKNKKAHDKLITMCALDTEWFIISDYDVITKRIKESKNNG
jgi:hypothetical protein